MIGGPFARSAFTFVAVVTRQVVSRRSAAGQVRLVLRAVESRTLDLVSRSRGERGGEGGGIQKPELPVAPVGIEKFQGPSPFPPPVHHNYGPPSTFHARTPSLGPPVFVPICRLRPPGNCH